MEWLIAHPAEEEAGGEGGAGGAAAQQAQQAQQEDEALAQMVAETLSVDGDVEEVGCGCWCWCWAGPPEVPRAFPNSLWPSAVPVALAWAVWPAQSALHSRRTQP